MNYRLRQCVWEITLACCFQCKYCGSSGGAARKNELSTDECLSVCDQLAELGCQRVNLIGGEVFMRRDWEAIVKKLRKLGIRVTIITNGFLFSEELIQKLRNCDVESVAVSIDGPEDVHDRYRQKGSYFRAMQAVRVLSEAGIPVSVISTLNRENTRQLESFYQTLKELPIFAWQLQACSPMGNAANLGMDYRFDFEEVLKFVFRISKEAPFSVGVGDNIGYYTEHEGYVRGDINGYGFYLGCQAGIEVIGIDSEGNVKGCESLYDPKFVEGNLRTRSLREIWEDPDCFSYNRKFRTENLTGNCSRCHFGEECRGGCRSYNYFVHGKLYESPACPGKFLKETT